MSEIDWAEIASLANHLAESEEDSFAVFTVVVSDFAWRPAPTILPEQLQFLSEWWLGLPRENSLPQAAAIDPLALRDVIGHIMILEPAPRDEGLDFRYRLYGTAIASHSGFDLTGKLVSESVVHHDVQCFFLACYRAVFDRRLPLYSRHEAPPEISVTAWSRLMLPFTDSEGQISRIVVGNYPGEKRPKAEAPSLVYEPGD